MSPGAKEKAARVGRLGVLTGWRGRLHNLSIFRTNSVIENLLLYTDPATWPVMLIFAVVALVIGGLGCFVLRPPE